MREADETTRQRLKDALRAEAASPSELARQFDLTPDVIVDHAEHVARSLEETDEELLVAPPTCRSCGFDEFDELLNRPSRCPDCKSESVREPTLTIE